MTKDFITLEYLNIYVMNILPLLNNESECTYESNEWLVGHPFLTLCKQEGHCKVIVPSYNSSRKM